MKQKVNRLISVILCLLLMSGLLPAAALADEQTKEAFAVDTVHQGFRVYQTETIDYMGIDLYFMEHEKTGAQLIYADCNDPNRAFGVSFRTQGLNDKGMPHVFEHSALSGSDKYPDSNLFFSMINQTYSSFMNAETRQFVTLYPVASLSEEQLFMNMDVYMSGVLHPILLKDKRAMMREAWHYNLDDVKSDITISGVVYSEMAANYNNMLYVAENKLKKLLFPGSRSASDIGGDPSVIPDMTYQELLDFHAKYYHPSNMLMMLYGDFSDVERFFAHLDTEYLSQYERKEIVLDDPDYKPLQGYQELYWQFPATQGTEVDHASHIEYAFVLDNLSRSDYLLGSSASAWLAAESSPLKQRISETFPVSVFSVSLDDTTLQPTMRFTLMNANAEDAPVFKNIIDEMLPLIMDSEIDHSVVDLMINMEKYQQATARESTEVGVSLFETFADNWAKTGKPDAYLEDFRFYNDLEQYQKNGSIDTILGKLLRNTTASAMLVATPMPGLAEQNAAELAKKLADWKASMTDEEIQALVAQCADYNAWIANNAKVSLIDQVKAVDAKSLPEEYEITTVTDETIDGVRYITSEVPGSDVFKVNIYLDAQGIPFESLLDASLATSLMGDIATENYSRDALQNEMFSKVNSILSSLKTVYFANEPSHLYLHISGNGLSEQLDDTFRLAEETVLHTVYTDYETIRESAANNAMIADLFSNSMPNLIMINIGEAAVNPDHYVDYYIGCSAEYKQYFEHVSQLTDKEMAAYMERIQSTLAYMLNRPGAIVTVIGNTENIARCIEKSKDFLSKLGNKVYEPVNYGDYSNIQGSTAFVIDTSVAYNHIFLNMNAAKEKLTGQHLVAQHLVTDLILLPELRFRNNAYGASNEIGSDFAYLSTYRDPELAKTYEIFTTIPEKLRKLELTDEQLNGYITAAYSSIVYPRGPIAIAEEAVNNALLHKDPANKLRYVQEIKATTADDIRAAADFYEKLIKNGTEASAVSEEMLTQNAERFETVLRRTDDKTKTVCDE